MLACYQTARDAGENTRIVSSFAPLIERHLVSASIPTETQPVRRVLALALRERERSRIVSAQHDRFGELFDREGINALPLRGVELACSCFPDAADRHCHATRWLVRDLEEFSRACEMVSGQGWSSGEASVLAPHRHVFRKPGAAEVNLHMRPFAWPVDPLPDHLADPHFLIIELSTSVIAEYVMRGGRWLVDLAMILRSNAIDPERLARVARECGAGETCRSAIHAVLDVAPEDDVELRQQCSELATALQDVADGRVANSNVRVCELVRARWPTKAFALLHSPLLARRAWHVRNERRAVRQDRRATEARLAERLS